MQTNTDQPIDTKSAEFQDMSERARKAAVIGAFIGIPAAWAIATATEFSFDNVVSAIVVLGGIGLLFIVKRAKDAGGDL